MRVIDVYVDVLAYPYPWAAGGNNWDEHKHQKVDIPPEEQKKNWWDLDEKRKKELEVRACWHRAPLGANDATSPRSVEVSPSALLRSALVSSLTTSTRRTRKRSAHCVFVNGT